VQSGGTATFVCAAGGDPQPEISWRKREEDGKSALPSAAKVDYDTGSLILRPSAPRDEGVYVCRAESDAGAVEASASLAVHGNFCTLCRFSFNLPFLQPDQSSSSSLAINAWA